MTYGVVIFRLKNTDLLFKRDHKSLTVLMSSYSVFDIFS